MWDLSFWFWTQLLCKLKWVFGDIFFFFFLRNIFGISKLTNWKCLHLKPRHYKILKQNMPKSKIINPGCLLSLQFLQTYIN